MMLAPAQFTIGYAAGRWEGAVNGCMARPTGAARVEGEAGKEGRMAGRSKVKRTVAGKAQGVEKRFVCEVKPDAQRVCLAGDFNGWDAERGRMSRRDGRFVKRLRLLPGEYQYKFFVDGEWFADPAAEAQAPNEFGTTNSVVRI